MTRVRYRIVHTDRTDASEVDLVQVFDFDTQEGIEASMDSFQFRLMLGSKPVRTFEVNDAIDIYIGTGDDDPTTLVINGIISELNFELSIDGMAVTVNGVNRVERLLFSPRPALYAAAFTHTDANSVARTGWDAVITHLIDTANEFKSSDDSTLITYDTTSIPDLGNLDRNYEFDWKSIFEHLETLASSEWAPNKEEYFIELDSSNKIHFRSKDTSTYQIPASNIDLDGANVLSTKAKYSMFEVINVVLLNCGKDENGNSVLVPYWDSSSANVYGAKFKYILNEEIANNYLKEHPGEDIAVQRNAIKTIGRVVARKIVSNLGQPRYRVDADLLGTTDYVRGKVYTVSSSNITNFGTTEPLRRLRLKNITHRFSARTGWSTRLQLEEDEKTISAYSG